MPLAALLAMFTVVAAAPPLDDDPAWRAATALLDEFAYDEALRRMEPLAQDEDRPAAERARVLLRMGMIHADLRREEDALRCFQRALALDARAVLPDSASPRVKEIVEEVRAEVMARGQKANGATAGSDAVAPHPSTTASVPIDPPADAGQAAPTPGFSLAPTLLVSGGLVAGAGLLAWGSGLALYGVAEQSHYQQDAAAYGDTGAVAQVAGQGLLALGAVVLAGGAVMLGLGR